MKIRGNTVGTTLRPDKVIVKATNLTEKEKAQARANIGVAGSLVVTFTPNWEEVYDPDNDITEEQIVSYTADVDYYDIAAAFAEGIVVIAKWSDDDGVKWNVACGGYADQDFPYGKVGPFVYDENAECWNYVGETGTEKAWHLLGTFDLSSGAVLFTVDTTGFTELLMVTTEALTCSGQAIAWKGSGIADVSHTAVGSIKRLEYLGDGKIVVTGARGNTDTLMRSSVATSASESNNTFILRYSSASAGSVDLWGR